MYLVCSIIAFCVVHVHIYTNNNTWKQGMIKNINDLRQATLTEVLATSDRENDEEILACHNTSFYDLLFFHIMTVW